MVEHRPFKPGVAGSSPARLTKCPRSLTVRTSPFQGGDRSSTLLEGTTLGEWLSGRALPSHGRGHRFKSCFAHHQEPKFLQKLKVFVIIHFRKRGRGVVVQHAGLSRRRPWVQIPSIPPILKRE